MAVTIFIKNHKGQAYTVQLDDTEFQGATVLDLKKKIEALERIPVSQQRLIFNGREVNDNFLLSYYGIQNASHIYSNLRLRGGAEPGGPGDPGLGDKDGKNRSNERLADF
ncbi:hypothetical protein OYC64_022143 [Pagothenia borchgrevinki]|uniref:Ubiquitin-like domain-containing protein n=1 Tax=Pagothenia borchgrevinki TaxID=8213 RepID=A0ABD2HMN7_PAGBO